MKRIPNRKVGNLEKTNTENVRQKKVCAGVTGEGRRKSLSLKGNVAKTALLCKDLGFKEKKGRECEGERHISPFLSKVAHQLQSAKNKGRTKLS